MLAHAEAKRVYGAARESHHERTKNTLKHSTCSHKWWETLKGTPPLERLSMGTEAVLCMMAPADKASPQGSQFVSKQCREQFVTSLSCFSLSRCNSLAFRTVLLRLLLDLDTSGSIDPLGVFPLFLKMVADNIAPKFSMIFHLLIRRGAFPEC